MSDQPSEIRSVIQHAMKSAIIELVYRDAYPDPVDGVRKICKTLLTSALNHTRPMQGLQFIKEHIKSPDHGFTDSLGRVFSSIHSEAKNVAERCILGYDLTGTKSVCIEHVEVLLAQENYAYPGTWVTGSDGAAITRTSNRGKLYASPPIIACMQGLYKWFHPYQQPDVFAASNKDHPGELEPPGLVALAATALSVTGKQVKCVAVTSMCCLNSVVNSLSLPLQSFR
ncbi:hypothetical protein E1B28_002966 [Marasmius oreades]|uniref:DUF6532 domain-containing protein n=1 Tax=Marasmius oreades TaxID=181124 RepID=A0A9P7RLK2_9AGAR|nr:uncharacterized protein E1B28_002966 [Marasmius oreades]KAG7085405.1 hypothetical protein E1B28_002966 [Marasmius oreades]